MNDLEERIRATLADRATAPAIRTMPSGTRGRIRSRQAGSALVAFAAATAFSFLTFQLFSAPSGASRTADAEAVTKVQIVQPPQGLDASLDLHDVDPPAPGEWPDVTRGDLRGAYVDYTVEEEVSIVVVQDADRRRQGAGRAVEPRRARAERRGGTVVRSVSRSVRRALPRELGRRRWCELLPPTGWHGGFTRDVLDRHRLGRRSDHGLCGGRDEQGRPHRARARRRRIETRPAAGRPPGRERSILRRVRAERGPWQRGRVRRIR